MTLSDLSSIVGVVGGLAVLGSLIYLALQTRQLEKNQRALMNQGVINRGTDTAKWIAEPHMSNLFAKMLSGETKFTGQEVVQMRVRLRNTLISTQDAYVQHKSGLVDQITYDSSFASLRGLLTLPVHRALWRLDRTQYAPDWTSYIDKLIEEMPISELVDRLAQFKADLAEVLH